MLGTLFALLPALALEAFLVHDPASFAMAQNPTEMRSNARRSLHLEAGLRRYTWNNEPAPQVMLLGNSLIAENLDVAVLGACCGKTERLVNFGLSLLEIAMLGERVIQVDPELLVLSVTTLDVYREPNWDGLRFYDPDVARQLSSTSELVRHSHAHLHGLVQRHLTLFRHRPAVLEVLGKKLGLPLAKMLSVAPKKPLVYAKVNHTELPTLQTRALAQMASRLRDADIGLLVFSSPTRTTGSQPDPRQADHTYQMDAHIDALARVHGFVYVPAGHLMPIDPALYKDPLHLLPAGRSLLTEKLVPHIQAALAQQQED